MPRTVQPGDTTSMKKPLPRSPILRISSPKKMKTKALWKLLKDSSMSFLAQVGGKSHDF